MEEHDAILQDAHDVRAALGSGDRKETVERLQHLTGHLLPHVHREEAGIFTALREQGDWADEVTQLEGEHHDLDAAIAEIDPLDASFAGRVLALLESLEEHIERENLGIFPVSVVTLGAPGWDIVADAHRLTPTFLPADGPQPVA
jgi:hypothetical protein